MTAGRKPKATALRILEGNPGHRPLNKSEPKPNPVAPTRPEWLLPEAALEWDRVTPVLERMGLLTIVDGVALAIYCQSLARYVAAEAQIEQYGSVLKTASGYVQPSPYVAISRQSAQAVRAFCTEFGFTPSSRGRMSVGEPDRGADCERCGLPKDTMCGCG